MFFDTLECKVPGDAAFSNWGGKVDFKPAVCLNK